MGGICRDLSPQALAGAVEANVVAFSLLPARGPGAQVHDEPGLLWYVTGLAHPVFNGVLRAQFTPGEVDARVGEVLARFRSNGWPLTWCTGPSARPPELGSHLQAQGLACTARMPGMAADLEAIVVRAPVVPGLAIAQVHDTGGLSCWLEPVGIGFDFDPGMARAMYDLYAAMGFDEDAALRHYVAWQHGEAVAAGSLYLAEGVAGLYCIATLPAARRRGIGTCLTLAMMQAARAAGYRIAILYATPMGIGLYRRLGFETVCTLTFYTWPPCPDETWAAQWGE